MKRAKEGLPAGCTAILRAMFTSGVTIANPADVGILHILAKRDYVDYAGEGDDGHGFSLTDKGRAYVADNGGRLVKT